MPSLGEDDLSALRRPYLSKIGAALQGSNLYSAQHIGQEIQNYDFQLQSSKSTAQVTKKLGVGKLNRAFTLGSIGLICLLDNKSVPGGI
jgi:hypothetical protein